MIVCTLNRLLIPSVLFRSSHDLELAGVLSVSGANSGVESERLGLFSGDDMRVFRLPNTGPVDGRSW